MSYNQKEKVNKKNQKYKYKDHNFLQDLSSHLLKLGNTLPSLNPLIKQRNFFHSQKEATTDNTREDSNYIQYNI